MSYGEQFTPEGLQYRWNSHSISAFEACPRKYYYTMICKWSSGNTSPHITFGSYYAEALEHFYRLRAEGLDREAAIHKTLHKTLIETYNWESDHKAKNREALIRTIVWYFDEFTEDLPVVYDTEGNPGVERKFEIDLDGDNFLVGTLDRVVYHGDDPFIMDQKTTSVSLSPSYFAQFCPHQQMSAYTFAGRMIFPNPIKGVIIDAVQVQPNYSTFARNMTFRTEAQLNEWYNNALFWINLARERTEMYLAGMSIEQAFPQNTSSCSMYSGCQFRAVCSKSPEVREMFLRGDFKQEEVDE